MSIRAIVAAKTPSGGMEDPLFNFVSKSVAIDTRGFKINVWRT